MPIAGTPKTTSRERRGSSSMRKCWRWRSRRRPACRGNASPLPFAKLQPHRNSPFQFQQSLLQWQSAAVSHQLSASPDDAVAWDYDLDGVGAVGCAGRSHGYGQSDGGGNLKVTAGFPVGNGLQLPPDAHLKIGSAQV